MKQSVAGIVYENGKFLVGHRLSGGEMSGRWEFPGGKVDAGETPKEALIREFREELNVTAAPLELIDTAEFHNRGGSVQLLAYHVRISGEIDDALTEHSEIEWATFGEIENLQFVDSDRLLFPAIQKWLGELK
jgi:8-oxo-dGTP diphosphatase